MALPGLSDCPLWLRRIGWLILIWTASVICLGILAALLRAVMNFAGLTA